MSTKMEGLLIVLAAAFGIAVHVGYKEYQNVVKHEEERKVLEELRWEKAHICIRQVERQGDAARRGAELLLDHFTDHTINGREVFVVTAKYVTVRDPTRWGAPSIYMTCEFAQRKLIKVHSVRLVR